MKKLVIIIAMIFSLNVISLKAQEQIKEFTATNLSSQNYILYSIDDDEVLLERNVDVHLSAASINKVLTTITALDLLKGQNLDKYIIVYPEALHYLNLESSKAGLVANEVLSLREVLYAIMLPSGADATAVMSMYLFDDADKLAGAMNIKAKEIGMKDTHIVNVSGLDDPNQYTTLNDLLILLKYSLQNEDFKEIYMKSSYTFKKTDLTVENPMLMMAESDPNSYIVGAKSGYTLDAKRSLSSLATDGNHSYLFISTQAEGGPVSDNEAYHDANKVYSQVFNQTDENVKDIFLPVDTIKAPSATNDSFMNALYILSATCIALVALLFVIRYVNIQKIKRRKRAILLSRQSNR